MFAVSVTNSLERGLNSFFEFLPQLIGAIIILIVGYLIAKVVQKIVQKSLHRMRFDRALHTSSAGNYIAKVVESPSATTGKATFWVIFIGAILLALSALNLSVLDRIVYGIYSYIPNVIAAILIFLVAGAVSAGATMFVRTTMGKTPTAKLIIAVIPAITMGIAVFMILDQLNIAENIVNITFTAIMASLSLGLALAFGLGGRDIAHQILQQAYQAGQANAQVAKRDVQRAKANTQQKAQEAQDKLNERQSQNERGSR